MNPMNRTQRRAAAKQGLPPPRPTIRGVSIAVRAGAREPWRRPFQQAEALYREILAVDPGMRTAWHLLGVLACQTRSKRSCRRVDRSGDRAEPEGARLPRLSRNALRNGGKLDAAIAAQRRALTLRPDFADAHSNLSNSLKDKGELDEAIRCYRRVIAIKPDFVDAHVRALFERGKPQRGGRVGAARAGDPPHVSASQHPARRGARGPRSVGRRSRFAVRLHPDFASAHLNLGNS